MICLLHGYLLEGSGSNLWTRLVVQALCRTGHTVHVVCQEPHPEKYDFIAEAHFHHTDGRIDTRLQRDAPYAGRCILHQPELGATLPVYVWDEYEEYERVVPMVELPDAEIERYIRRNVDVVRRVVKDNGITVIQANHVVLMSVVAQRVAAETGVPFFVMPHGSALEYAVKPDPRMHEYASAALTEAKGVLVSANELGERVLGVFPDVPGLAEKMSEIRVGVDTRGFQPITREERPASIEAVAELLRPLARGRAPEQTETMLAALPAGPAEGGAVDARAVSRALASAAEYDGKAPDVGAEDALRRVEWSRGQVVLFVGRIIVAKGIHCVIGALPQILRNAPGTQLVVAGHGPLREPLEALLHALRTGNRALAECIAAGDPSDDRLNVERMDGLPEYWAALDADGQLDQYYEDAARLLRPDTVNFIGYMTHRELAWIFPCCDVGIFPSMVRESGPMVFLEALASGCFPVGSYFAGTKDKIDSVAPYLDADDVEAMKLRPDPHHLAGDIARVVPRALALGNRYDATLRTIAEQEYDWRPIADRLARTLLGA